MTRKLNEADRAAVDLLFDRLHAANGTANGGEGVVIVTENVSENRLSAVQRILSVLDHAPAPEPPSDLVVRTLQALSRRTDGAIQPPASFIDPTQPQA